MTKKKQGPQKPKRAYSAEYKAGAVRLVLEEGRALNQVSRDLDIPPGTLHRWVEEARGSKPQGAGKEALTGGEREELLQLRREVKQLEMERDFLKNPLARCAGTLLQQKPRRAYRRPSPGEAAVNFLVQSSP